jgi:CO/xanthine dehydrogenase FAD-binding subunit
MLLGQRPSKDLLATAAQSCAELASLEDPYASAAYRGQVAAAMAEHALAEALAEARTAGVFA